MSASRASSWHRTVSARRGSSSAAPRNLRHATTATTTTHRCILDVDLPASLTCASEGARYARDSGALARREVRPHLWFSARRPWHFLLARSSSLRLCAQPAQPGCGPGAAAAELLLLPAAAAALAGAAPSPAAAPAEPCGGWAASAPPCAAASPQAAAARASTAPCCAPRGEGAGEGAAPAVRGVRCWSRACALLSPPGLDGGDVLAARAAATPPAAAAAAPPRALEPAPATALLPAGAAGLAPPAAGCAARGVAPPVPAAAPPELPEGCSLQAPSFCLPLSSPLPPGGDPTTRRGDPAAAAARGCAGTAAAAAAAVGGAEVGGCAGGVAAAACPAAAEALNMCSKLASRWSRKSVAFWPRDPRLVTECTNCKRARQEDV